MSMSEFYDLSWGSTFWEIFHHDSIQHQSQSSELVFFLS